MSYIQDRYTFIASLEIVFTFFMGITKVTVKLFQVRLKRIHPYLNALNGRIRKKKNVSLK